MSANEYVAARHALEALRDKLLPIARTYSQIGAGIIANPAKFYFWDVDRSTDPSLKKESGVTVIDQLAFQDPLEVNLDLIEYRRAVARLQETYGALDEATKKDVVAPADLLGPLV